MATFFEQWIDRRMRATTKKDYIEFVDPVVAQICADTWGDGIGITYAQAAAVTSIPTNTFRSNTSIVSFDEFQYFTSLTTIPSYCFAQCSNLASIVFPSSITTIKGEAFNGCSSLQIVVNLPNLVLLEASAFKATKITSVANLGSITAINSFTFENCSSLMSVTLPSTVSSIGNKCFTNCSSLVTINLPTAITSIGQDCFNGCPLLEGEINLPNLTSIGASAFKTTSISRVLSLGSITAIPSFTFQSCTHLTDVALPSTLAKIYSNSFIGDTALTTVTVSGTPSFSIDNAAFQDCSSLSSFPFVCATSVGNYSFYRCTSLTAITFSGSLSSIGNFAFNACAITTVSYTGNGTFSIGARAFQNCPLVSFPTAAISSTSGDYSLHRNVLSYIELSSAATSFGYGSFIRNRRAETTVIIRKTTPPTNSGRLFYYDSGGSSFYVNDLLKIYVPWSIDHSVLNAYKAAPGWDVDASRMYELDENGNIPT